MQFFVCDNWHIELDDKAINDMLNKAQHEVVGANIRLHQAEKELEVAQRQEEIIRIKAESAAVTAKRNSELQEEMIGQQLSVQQAKISSELASAQKQKEANLAKEEVINVASQGELQRTKARTDQEVAVETQKQTLRSTESGYTR